MVNVRDAHRAVPPLLPVSGYRNCARTRRRSQISGLSGGFINNMCRTDLFFMMITESPGRIGASPRWFSTGSGSGRFQHIPAAADLSAHAAAVFVRPIQLSGISACRIRGAGGVPLCSPFPSTLLFNDLLTIIHLWILIVKVFFPFRPSDAFAKILSNLGLYISVIMSFEHYIFQELCHSGLCIQAYVIKDIHSVIVSSGHYVIQALCLQCAVVPR